MRRGGLAAVLLALAAPGLAADTWWWEPPPHLPRRAIPLILVVVRAAEDAGVPEWTPRLAAQIDAESAWQPDARSPFAEGLAQFTAPTAADMSRLCAGLAAAGDWRRPAWQAAAQVCYLRRLARYCGGAEDVECWRVRWASYNAGPGWIRRERRATAAAGGDPDRWAEWSRTCRRATRHCAETRGYVERIERLLALYR